MWPLDFREILVHQVNTVVYESFGMKAPAIRQSSKPPPSLSMTERSNKDFPARDTLRLYERDLAGAIAARYVQTIV